LKARIWLWNNPQQVHSAFNSERTCWGLFQSHILAFNS
jgi:hypothetical protein